MHGTFLLPDFQDCATRPGLLNNATVDDYASAESHEGIKVMLVARHKRSKDGPATLPMVPDLQRVHGHIREQNPTEVHP